MKTTPSQYAQALWELSQDKTDADTTRMAADFLALLRRKGESKKLTRIVQKLEQLQDTSTETNRVSVTTAFPVNVALAKELETFAQKTFESQLVAMEIHTDETLLGGLVMQTDNHRVDASLAGRMQKLRKVLLK